MSPNPSLSCFCQVHGQSKAKQGEIANCLSFHFPKFVLLSRTQMLPDGPPFTKWRKYLGTRFHLRSLLVRNNTRGVLGQEERPWGSPEGAWGHLGVIRREGQWSRVVELALTPPQRLWKVLVSLPCGPRSSKETGKWSELGVGSLASPGTYSSLKGRVWGALSWMSWLSMAPWHRTAIRTEQRNQPCPRLHLFYLYASRLVLAWLRFLSILFALPLMLWGSLLFCITDFYSSIPATCLGQRNKQSSICCVQGSSQALCPLLVSFLPLCAILCPFFLFSQIKTIG